MISGTDVDLSNVVALFGSTLALLGVIIGGAVAAVTQRRHWRFAEQVEACACFLRNYTSVHLQYVMAVNSGNGATASSTSDFVDWRPFNEALEVLNLMAAREIVDVAHELDRVLWEVGLQIVHGNVAKWDWGQERDKLEGARLEFVNTVRSSLGKGKEPLLRLSGRPPDDDPIWSQNTMEQA